MGGASDATGSEAEIRLASSDIGPARGMTQTTGEFRPFSQRVVKERRGRFLPDFCRPHPACQGSVHSFPQFVFTTDELRPCRGSFFIVSGKSSIRGLLRC